MTKVHYQKLAAMVILNYRGKARENLARRLAETLKGTDHRFNPELFIKACGVKEE